VGDAERRAGWGGVFYGFAIGARQVLKYYFKNRRVRLKRNNGSRGCSLARFQDIPSSFARLRLRTQLAGKVTRRMKQDLVRVRNTSVPALRRPLTAAQFGDLAEIPPELEWLANLTNRKPAALTRSMSRSSFAGLSGIAEANWPCTVIAFTRLTKRVPS
jgi:hypothetical protein